MDLQLGTISENACIGEKADRLIQTAEHSGRVA